MKVLFKELTLNNHKSHQHLHVNFGEVTEISGDNAWVNQLFCLVLVGYYTAQMPLEARWIRHLLITSLMSQRFHYF